MKKGETTMTNQTLRGVVIGDYQVLRGVVIGD
jgi:hypothetical protein